MASPGLSSFAYARSVRWGDYMFIRTYHTGLKDMPSRMLFNVAAESPRFGNTY